MTDPKPPGWKEKPPKGGAFAIIVLCCGIAAALAPSEGGQRLTPYLDSALIPTACTGIIGAEVTRRYKAKLKFTKAECDKLDTEYLAKMVPMMQRCVPTSVRNEMTYGEWVTYGHWAYNTGTGSFCQSSLARHLAAGDHVRACKAMGNWTFITVRGQKRDCRIPANKCSGIAKRRLLEVSMCLEALP